MMRNYGLAGLALVIATAMVAPPASAHHSYAMFAVTKQVAIEGTVKQFMWTNPHSWIRLEVMDAKGQPQEWSVEMSSLTILVARRLESQDGATWRQNPHDRTPNEERPARRGFRQPRCGRPQPGP